MVPVPPSPLNETVHKVNECVLRSLPEVSFRMKLYVDPDTIGFEYVGVGVSFVGDAAVLIVTLSISDTAVALESFILAL